MKTAICSPDDGGGQEGNLILQSAARLRYNAAMSANAFAISRRLVEKGMDKPIADAVAEEIVTHADDSHATKHDIAVLEGKITAVEERLGGRINALDAKMNILFALNVAIFITLVIDKLA